MKDSLSREAIHKEARIGIQIVQLFMEKIEKAPVDYSECRTVMENICSIFEKIQNGSFIGNLVEPSRRIKPKRKKS